MPLAAHATLDHGRLRIDAAWGNPTTCMRHWYVPTAKVLQLICTKLSNCGLKVAALLREQGAA
jgi:hypothetical protein